MHSVEVPPQFRSCISDDGTQALLAKSNLTELPGWLSNLTALVHLDMSGNQLTAVPESLGNLTALTAAGPER